VNLFMTVQAPGDLADGLYGSLLDHELSHDLGWQHWWPTGTGATGDQMIWKNDNSCFGYLFFGWTGTGTGRSKDSIQLRTGDKPPAI
jgi:hypothetical protein